MWHVAKSEQIKSNSLPLLPYAIQALTTNIRYHAQKHQIQHV
jgi:hypothetical protein